MIDISLLYNRWFVYNFNESWIDRKLLGQSGFMKYKVFGAAWPKTTQSWKDCSAMFLENMKILIMPDLKEWNKAKILGKSHDEYIHGSSQWDEWFDSNMPNLLDDSMFYNWLGNGWNNYSYCYVGGNNNVFKILTFRTSRAIVYCIVLNRSFILLHNTI